MTLTFWHLMEKIAVGTLAEPAALATDPTEKVTNGGALLTNVVRSMTPPAALAVITAGMNLATPAGLGGVTLAAGGTTKEHHDAVIVLKKCRGAGHEIAGKGATKGHRDAATTAAALKISEELHAVVITLKARQASGARESAGPRTTKEHHDAATTSAAVKVTKE